MLLNLWFLLRTLYRNFRTLVLIPSSLSYRPYPPFPPPIPFPFHCVIVYLLIKFHEDLVVGLSDRASGFLDMASYVPRRHALEDPFP